MHCWMLGVLWFLVINSSWTLTIIYWTNSFVHFVLMLLLINTIYPHLSMQNISIIKLVNRTFICCTIFLKFARWFFTVIARWFEWFVTQNRALQRALIEQWPTSYEWGCIMSLYTPPTTSNMYYHSDNTCYLLFPWRWVLNYYIFIFI